MKASAPKSREKPQQTELQGLQSEVASLRAYVAVMEKTKKRLASLSAISNIITQSVDFRDVLNLTADKLMDMLEADAIRVYLLDEAKGELVLELWKGVSADFAREVKRMKVGEGYNGQAAVTGKPLALEDLTAETVKGRHAVINEGLKSQLIVPLKSKGKVIGTLSIAQRRPTKFDRDEIGLLSSIGNHIGANLESARVYEDMKRALRQFQQSEERYRDLFENASDAIWVHDFDNQTLAVNKACEKVTGYSSEELMGISICKLMSPSGKARMAEIEGRLLREVPVDPRSEMELLKKGKAKSIVEVTTSVATHEGKPVGFQHSARDVTDERKMQENLRFYLQQVTRAQEEERRRIAQELHDETLQNLVVISRQLDKITSSEALWEVSLEVVRGLKKQIETAMQEMRRFSHDLRPSVLDDLGLLPALELLADDLEKQGIATIFKVSGTARRLQPEEEVMLFRIAQEAVRNIWRHAHASEAEMLIEFTDGTLKMSIKDNGIGFRLPYRTGDLAGLGKLGLVGMHERVTFLGGTLTLQSKPGEGTQIVVEVRI